MTLELCAVVDRVPPSIAPARAIGDGPFVIVEDTAGRSVTERLAARLALLRAITGVSCVPFRIGSTVADEVAALDWLRERRDAVDEALARSLDRVEFDLHLASTARAPVDDRGGPGARHLQELASRYARIAPADVSAALEACRGLPAVAETAVAEDDGYIAFLVSDPRSFTLAARGVALAGSRWSGPWPAFTFAARWIA